MTRQYPDQYTPARFLPRAASAARAASFKSAYRELTLCPRIQMHHRGTSWRLTRVPEWNIPLYSVDRSLALVIPHA